MTDREKILAKCKAESGVGDEAEMRGLRYENARLTPILRALLTDRERLIAAVRETRRALMDLSGSEPEMLTKLLAQSAQTTREILNEEKT